MPSNSKRVEAPSQAESTSTVQPPAFNFTSVKKTNLDIFAVAPQAKKMTRRAKAQLELDSVQERQDAGHGASKASAPASQKGGSESKAKPAPSQNKDDDIFQTVLVEDEKTHGGTDATGKTGNTQKDSQRKGKKQILRHALQTNPEEDERTVFVGNLPNTIKKREVERFFKDCGAIESVRVRSQALEAANEKSANAGRGIRVLRGEVKKDEKCSATAYVLFRDRASVARALQKNGILFLQRHVVVTTLTVDGAAYPPETSIFIGNIAYDTSEEEVWNFFVEKGIPDVKRVRLVRDRDSGACKGFGYVEFMSPASVQPAISVRGNVLNGREIRIVHANKSKVASAAVASRRDMRSKSKNENTPAMGAKRQRTSVEGADAVRGGKAKQTRMEKSGHDRAAQNKKTKLPSWVGVVTNPRKKIPKDLRPLIGGEKPKPKGPRPPVKHKMRNPEKA